MKSKLKKSLSLLLALVMAMSCMSLGAFATQLESETGAVASATVGEVTTYYTRLEEAINAAFDGGTVTLLKDVTVDCWHTNIWTLLESWPDGFTSWSDYGAKTGDGQNGKISGRSDIAGPTNLTIDGNEHSLTVNGVDGYSGGRLFNASTNLTVNNLTINAGAGVSGIGLKSGVIDGVTFNMTDTVALFVGRTVENDESIEIRNCKFNMSSPPTNAAGHYAILTDGGAENVTISGNTFNTNRSIVLRDNIQFLNNVVNSIDGFNVDTDATGVVSGNYFAAGKTRSLNLYSAPLTKIENNVILSPIVLKTGTPDLSKNYWTDGKAPENLPNGVTYSSYYTVANNLPAVTDVGASFTLSNLVGGETYVAQIGTTGYETLEAAFAAAQALGTATINVIADCELANPVSIPAGKDITLDLGSYTVTLPAGFVGDHVTSTADGVYLTNQKAVGVTAITNEGKLTIKGTGTIDGTAITSVNGYTFVGTSDSSLDTQYLINNLGTLDIQGGNFKLYRFMKTVVLRSQGTATLDGCTFDAWSALLNDDGGQMTIDGGTYNGWAFSAPKNYAKNPGAYRYAVAQYGEGSKMTINGGEVYGIHGAVGISVADVEINGGYFESRVPAEGVFDQAADKTYEKVSTFYGLYIAGERGKTTGTINGGTFVGNGRAAYIGNSGDGGVKEQANVVIHGGEFRGKTSNAVHVDKVVGTLYVDGGTFYGTSFLTGLTEENVVADNCEAKLVGSNVTVGDKTYSKMYVIGKVATANNSTATVTETKNEQNQPVYTVYKDNNTAVELVDPTVTVNTNSITNNVAASELVNVAGVLAEAAVSGDVTANSTFEIEVVKGDIQEIADGDKPGADIASGDVIEVHPELITKTTGQSDSRTEISNSNIKNALTFKVNLGTKFANKTVTLKHLWKDGDDWVSETLPGKYAVDADGYVSDVSLNHFSYLDPTVVGAKVSGLGGSFGNSLNLKIYVQNVAEGITPTFKVKCTDKQADYLTQVDADGYNASDETVYRVDWDGNRWVITVKVFAMYATSDYTVEMFNGDDLTTPILLEAYSYGTMVKADSTALSYSMLDYLQVLKEWKGGNYVSMYNAVKAYGEAGALFRPQN